MMSRIRSSYWPLISAIVLGLAATPAAAQTCSDSTVPGTLIGFTPLSGGLTRPNSCNLLPCYEPELAGGPTVEPDPGCDALSGPCPVRAKVALDFPGNSQMPTNAHVRVFWFDQATPDPGECLPPPFGSCSPISICGPLGAEILVDKGEIWIQRGVSCADIASGAYQQQSFSISAYACQTPLGDCTERLDVPGIELPPAEELWELMCEPPPPPCNQCPCNIGGGPGGGPFGGGPPGFGPPDGGPGARLRYQGRGAGHPGHPGTPAWNATLGRYWSHDYAQRIALDPDDLSDQHVWLITAEAAFLEFENLSGGVYQTVTPSDELRRLSRTATGWTLRQLDGIVHTFDGSGLWQGSEDRNGNTKDAVYTGGVLTRVDFPDGRSETFAYHPDGKLATITEVGVGGAAQRTWSYTWSGLDLARIDRPDSTALVFAYHPTLPGYITRMTLVGRDGGQRIASAWAYDGRGNVRGAWTGDASFSGASAADAYGFSYDNPYRPTRTIVTDPFGNATTYVVARDPGGVKPRIESIAGTCGNCNLGPDTRLHYDDPRHPLLPTRSIDASGTTTLTAYDANGQMTSRTEALGTPIERTTTWEYHGTFPGLVTAIERPSTSGSGVRRTSWIYDAGNATLQTEDGVENGSAFSYQTVTTYNPAGMPESVDPPGFGTTDQTGFAYDPNRGNLIVSSRTDPLVGTTSFDYDPFNRRTSVTDVNGVATETAYDDLDRVTAVIRKGAAVADDLVTTNVYDEYGDLFRTLLPEGNVIQYGYDAAGRLISIERRPDAVTPAERTFYTLDAFGHRARQDFQRWDGAGWVTESFTGFEYSSPCHLDKALHAGGTVTEYAYGCEGKLERVWDANHPSGSQSLPATQSYAYDDLDRLVTVTRPWDGAGGGSAVTAHGYDAQNHLIRVTDANGTVTSYVYSDRDLLTEEVSEVSGRTTFRYNEHGERIEETDARGVTVLRQLDALDRVRFVDYPGDALDVTYRYDEPAVPFSRGRLTAIERPGAPVSYRYDRFGRLTQDGALTFGYDGNGNRITVDYPGGVTARYSHDLADRQATLALEGVGAASGPVATAAEYLPSGPLSRLELGNGLTEVRDFGARYFPTRITVGEIFDWSYATDAVGNITGITDGLGPAGSRSYGYQDVHYFLTSGHGPWGELSWTYDKIGNRLSETRDGATAAYSYFPNAAGGSSPRLAAVTGAGSEVTSYFYDAIGDLTTVAGSADKTRYSYDAARRLSRMTRDVVDEPPVFTDVRYDGRSYLDRATMRRFSAAGASEPRVETTATYSSDGLLHHRGSVEHPDPAAPRETPITAENVVILYFAGRPVAQVVLRPGEGAAVNYLTTDHLGTPVLATDGAGAQVWSGGFEPFGIDWNGAAEAGVFLRFPGQWVDRGWQAGGSEDSLFYNVHRWYQPELGRYGRVDPIKQLAGTNNWLYEPNVYAYVNNNPLQLVDSLGLYGTNDCSYYDKRCDECGGGYYCSLVKKACRRFPSYPDPDPSTDNDFEGWARCTRKCLQDCDDSSFKRRKKCDPNLCEGDSPDSATDEFWDKVNFDCHVQCYSFCHFWGTWGEGDPIPNINEARP